MKVNTNQPASSQSSPLPPAAPAPRTHSWGWTGFAGKTLWDWLQLFATLAIPLALGLVTYNFNDQQATLAQNQHIADQQGALDQQREAALQSYLDRMSDLLHGNGPNSPSLATAKANDQLSQIARARTLTVLRSLDGRRKGLVLQFLYEAGLIRSKNSPGPIVDLHGADLTKTRVTINGLIAQSGPNNAGFAPISLQFNGHPAFESNYTLSGGGYQPTSQSFSAPPEQLVAGSNTLILTVAPNTTTAFWLYRLQVDLKSP